MFLKKSRAISNTAAIAIIVILVVAVGAGVYFATSGGGGTTTVTTTSTGTGSTATVTTTSTSTSTSVSTETTGSTTSTSSTGPAVEPAFAKANTWVAESAANFQYLDPQVEYYTYDNGIMLNVYESLMWWNGTNTAAPIPWLASNMTEVNPSTYVFGLRQGIKFQDGTPFNATAVCFSFYRDLILDAAQPTGPGVSSGWIMEQLTNTSLFSFFGASPDYSPQWVNEVLGTNFCQIINNYKVQINLLYPTGAFPVLMANSWSQIVSPSFIIAHDYPAALMSSDPTTAYFDHQAGNGTTYLNAHPGLAGTGPYEITYVNPTTYEVKLTANQNYWGGPPGVQFGPIHPTIQTIDF